MRYRVVLTDGASEELQEDAIWWAEHRDSAQALQWFDGFIHALNQLSENPVTYPVAAESVRYSVDLRQMLYGIGKKPTHRAVFQVCGNEVVVHGIRHLARNDLRIDDFEP